MSEIGRIIKQARDQARLRPLILPRESSRILLNCTGIGISVMMVL